MSVAGHILPDHVAFGQKGDDDGDTDGDDQDSHQELPVLRGIVFSASGYKTEEKQ